MRSRLVVIVGATGVGKSRLALQLAPHFNGEIVSADSRQVYRNMDIGTAKPTPEELSCVRHHLIDIVDPDEEFSLARYQQMASKAIAGINSRGRLPLLVGGSGQYVWAVLEGWGIPKVPPNAGFRRNLEEIAARGGGESLYQQLVETDPQAAQRIDRSNIRRIIRALEVRRSAPTPASRLQTKKEPPFDFLIIGLTLERAELYRRIDARADRMLERGLVEEVQKLFNKGYGLHLPSMSGIGYRQIGMYLRGELNRETAVQKMKYETHRFVRHQDNWFRLDDKRIHWFDARETANTVIERLVTEFTPK